MSGPRRGMRAAIRVLVVEREPAQQRLFSAALGESGFDVDFVASTIEARDHLEGSAPRPSVILTDLVPGAEVEETLGPLVALAATVGASLLVVSGRGGREIRERALQAGADGFLTKPFSLDQLRSEVRRVGRGREPGDARDSRTA